MFTAKVIEDHREWGISTVRWTFIPPHVAVTSDDKDINGRLYLFCDEKDYHVEEIDNGDIYIMNESGKTVADYHLGNRPNVVTGESK